MFCLAFEYLFTLQKGCLPPFLGKSPVSSFRLKVFYTCTKATIIDIDYLLISCFIIKNNWLLKLIGPCSAIITHLE